MGRAYSLFVVLKPLSAASCPSAWSGDHPDIHDFLAAPPRAREGRPFSPTPLHVPCHLATCGRCFYGLDLVAGRGAFGRTVSRKDRRVFLLVSHGRRTAGMASVHALFEESPLRRVARQIERCPKVFAGGIEAAAAKLKLTKRSRVERISSKAIAVNDRADLITPPLGSLVLSIRYTLSPRQLWCSTAPSQLAIAFQSDPPRVEPRNERMRSSPRDDKR
jgi:hypothetical protein